MLRMNCDIAERRASVVSVAGDIDWTNSGQLHAAIHQALTRDRIARLVVDLHGVTRIDSSGLGTLLDGLRVAKHRNVPFILCGLETTLFEIRPTRQEALQRFATSG
jgi:anti-anti-sigma factor